MLKEMIFEHYATHFMLTTRWEEIVCGGFCYIYDILH